MASTVTETSPPATGHPPSGNSSSSSSEHAISPGQTSPPRPPAPERKRSVAFSEEVHPNRSRPSTAPTNASDQAGVVSRQNEQSTVSGQDHDRDGDGQPTTPMQSEAPSSPPTSASSSQDLKQPWYRRIASNYRSISLENKGSVARDHLALERTFLAWLRTSLAFASIGIAITQLFRLNTSLADQNQRHRRRDLLDYRSRRDGAGGPPLPLSPFMGASLTPEIYSHIQTVLQGQEYPIYNPSDNTASTLLDQLLRPTEFDSDAAAKLRHLGKPLGATFIGISIVILFIGFHRYFESQHWIIRGHFPASRGSIAMTGLIAVALIVASLVVVLVVAPAAYNK